MAESGTNPVGARLQRARQAAGLSRHTLAGEVGISEETLRSYETGRRTLPADLLPALSVTLAVDAGWLVGAPGASRESVASTLTTIERLLRRAEDRMGTLRRLLDVPGQRRTLPPK